MKLSIIAAIGKNGELGRNNHLLWNLPGDMKFFKEMTSYHTVVMGRKTFESLPKILPNRKSIVISHQNIDIPGIEVFHSVENFLTAYEDFDEEVFNIGGASLYETLLDYTSKLYLTEVNKEALADTYFPKFNEEDYIKETLDVQSDYKHVLYKRRKL